MAHFKYKAVDRSGKLVESSVEQASVEAVADWLAREGMTALSIVPVAGRSADQKSGASSRSGGKSRDRVLHFTRELSVMLSSGLPLDRSLGILDELSDSATREMVQALRAEVRKGRGLADAFAMRPEFTPFYISMIRAGEAGGSLEGALIRMTEYLERAKALRQMISSAMTYPLILLSVAILSLVFLLAYVVPSFADLFTDMGGSLPMPTRVVMALGDFMANWWYVVLGAVAGGHALVRQILRKESVKAALDVRVLRWPLIGELVRNLETSRFSRTLGVLLQGGVPLVGALAIARETIGNRVLKGHIDVAVAELKEGKSLSASLLSGGNFPPLAVHMMQVGEETGRLEEMLLKVAGIYEDEVSAVTDRKSTRLNSSH